MTKKRRRTEVVADDHESSCNESDPDDDSEYSPSEAGLSSEGFSLLTGGNGAGLTGDLTWGLALEEFFGCFKLLLKLNYYYSFWHTNNGTKKHFETVFDSATGAKLIRLLRRV